MNIRTMSINWKRSTLTLALCGTLAACGSDNNDDDKTPNTDFELQLLHFADVDGGRDIINNATRFSALLKKFRTEHPNNTLVLSSGDNWIPGPEYNIAKEDAMAQALGKVGAGRAHIAYLNALGVQASAFGNHEFDLGTGDIASVLAADGNYPGAQFPYLSTNLNFAGDSNLQNLVIANGEDVAKGKGKITGSTVITVNGQRIGVVGATTPTLGSISSPGSDIVISGKENTAALAAEIQKSVDALTNAGINKIILLAHMQQITIERQLAGLLSNVDIIVAGGSNTILADSNDRLRDGDNAADTYPISLTSQSNEPILVVNTDGDYTYLGRLMVEFDQQGLIITQKLNDKINGAYAADAQGMTENNLNADTNGIPAVKAISDALTSALQTVAGNVMGISKVYLNGERNSVRSEETNLGNLTADANLIYAQGYETAVAISLKNGGGIRAPIGRCVVPAGSVDSTPVCSAPSAIPAINLPEGGISQLDVQTTLRFNNKLTLTTVTGKQLKEILEHSVAGLSSSTPTSGSFPQVSGITISYDLSKTAQVVTADTRTIETAGSRIQTLTVTDANGADAGTTAVNVVTNGVLDTTAANQTFRLVTLNYLAGYNSDTNSYNSAGGSDFPIPVDTAANPIEMSEQTAPANFVNAVDFAVFGSEQDALAEYLKANYNTADTAYNEADTAADTRIKQVTP